MHPMLRALAGAGRGGDTTVAHLSPKAAAALKARGGSGSNNPSTGLREYVNPLDFLSDYQGRYNTWSGSGQDAAQGQALSSDWSNALNSWTSPDDLAKAYYGASWAPGLRQGIQDFANQRGINLNTGWSPTAAPQASSLAPPVNPTPLSGSDWLNDWYGRYNTWKSGGQDQAAGNALTTEWNSQLSGMDKAGLKSAYQRSLELGGAMPQGIVNSASQRGVDMFDSQDQWFGDWMDRYRRYNDAGAYNADQIGSMNKQLTDELTSRSKSWSPQQWQTMYNTAKSTQNSGAMPQWFKSQAGQNGIYLGDGYRGSQSTMPNGDSLMSALFGLGNYFSKPQTNPYSGFSGSFGSGASPFFQSSGVFGSGMPDLFGTTQTPMAQGTTNSMANPMKTGGAFGSQSRRNMFGSQIPQPGLM